MGGVRTGHSECVQFLQSAKRMNEMCDQEIQVLILTDGQKKKNNSSLFSIKAQKSNKHNLRRLISKVRGAIRVLNFEFNYFLYS